MNGRDTMTNMPIRPPTTYGVKTQGDRWERNWLSVEEEEKELWRRDSETSAGSSRMSRLEKLEEGLEMEGMRYVRRERERARRERTERSDRRAGIMKTMEVSVTRG
jgi:hypothetical protein